MGWRIHTGTGLPRFRAGWVRMTRATRNAAWSRASFPELVPTIAFSTLPRSLTNIHTWVVPSMPCSIMPEARYSRTTACSISFLLKSDPTTTLTSSSATLGAEAHPAAKIALATTSTTGRIIGLIPLVCPAMEVRQPVEHHCRPLVNELRRLWGGSRADNPELVSIFASPMAGITTLIAPTGQGTSPGAAAQRLVNGPRRLWAGRSTPVQVCFCAAPV